MLIYKIRRVDGLFSTGGIIPKFNKLGKTWNRLCDLRRHFDNLYLSKLDIKKVYHNCVVVVFNDYDFVPIGRFADETREKYE